MAEFKHDDPLVRFTVPDRPTVRQQLEYQGAATFLIDKERLISWWNGALTLIDEWECELISDPRNFNFDEVDDPKIADVIRFVGMKTVMHMNALGDIPKNS